MAFAGVARLVSALALTALLVSLTPSAAAAIEGEVRVDLYALDEAGIEADLTLTDTEAEELRQRADHDDDGEVGSLEVAGAERALGDRFEGETEAYTLDGNSYRIGGASVDTEDLRGEVNRSLPVAMTIEAEARVSPGSAPHTFAIDGFPAGVPGETAVAHVVTAPGGYGVAETEGFAEEDTCQARTAPGTERASLELETGEACSQQTPLGPAAGLLAGVAAAVSASRRRQSAP